MLWEDFSFFEYDGLEQCPPRCQNVRTAHFVSILCYRALALQRELWVSTLLWAESQGHPRYYLAQWR